MRYERLKTLLELAILLQGRHRGMTINEIASEFDVTRRTAERMRNAIEDGFGPLTLVKNGERQRHWRLQSPDLRSLIRVSAEELAALEKATTQLESTGLFEQAQSLRDLGVKVHAAQKTVSNGELTDDYELLLRTEKLAMRPGPHINLEPGLLRLVRSAVKSARKLAFEYHARHSGQVSQQLVSPYGVVFGSRTYHGWTSGVR